MSQSTLDAFVVLVRKSQLLTPEQLDEIARDLQPRYTEAKALARELVRRGWTTVYQINQLIRGKGQDLILGQYELLERLGEGGMGEVFKARHRNMGRIVALKVLRRERVSNPDAVRRFHREIQAAARLSHPNVVMAYDASSSGNTHFIVMEYVDGVDLSMLVKKSGPLTIERACRCMYQASVGLQHAFELGMVHRDIKPHNLLLTRDGQTLKILDMGLARLGGDEDAAMSALTADGKVVGTPDYIAPEQARDSHSADVRSDLYSLGCTFYYVLTGRVPFPGGSLMEKLMRHQTEDPVPIETLRADVPLPIRGILRKLISRRPNDRYQTPADLAAALQPFVFNLESADSTLPAFEPSRSNATLPSFAMLEVPPQVLAALRKRRAEAGAPRRSFRVLVGVVAGAVLSFGMVVAVLVGFLLVSRSRRSGPGPEDPGTKAEQKPGPREEVPRSPLDRLAAAKIPAEKRPNEAPGELVAVLGDSRGRHWGPGMIARVLFSADGQIIASSSFGDNRVRLWDAHTLREIASLSGESGFNASFAFAPNRRSIISIAPDGLVSISDIADSGAVKKVHSYRGPQLFGVHFSPDRRTAAGVRFDRETRKTLGLHLWDIRSGNSLPAPTVTGFVGQCAFSPDGKTLAIPITEVKDGKNTAHVTLWNLETHQSPGSFDTVSVQQAPLFAPDGKRLYVLDAGTLKIVDIAKEIVFKTPFPSVATIALSPDGQTLACVSVEQNGTSSLILCDPITSQPRMKVSDPELRNTSLTFSPDGKLLAGHGLREAGLRLWDTATLKPVPLPPGYTGGASAIAFAPDSGRLAFGAADLSVRLWDLAARIEIASASARMSAVTFLALQGDHAVLAGGSSFNGRNAIQSVRHYDLETGLATTRLNEPFVNMGFQGMHCAYDPIHKLLVMPTRQLDKGRPVSVARFVDVDSGNEKRVLHASKEANLITAVALTSDGKHLALAEWGLQGREAQTVVSVRDAASDQEQASFSVSRAQVRVLDFNSAGTFLAALRGDGNVVLWNLATKQGLPLSKLLGQSTAVNTLAFSPTAMVLAVGCHGNLQNRYIEVWDPTAGKPTFSLPGQSAVTALAFRPDGKFLASANQRGDVDVWDLSNGQPVHHWSFSGVVSSLRFSGDGRYLLTGNGNGTVYVLRLSEAAGTLPK